jgi:ubiquinone/menaquinone biosynthesis C-methylase UbiE
MSIHPNDVETFFQEPSVYLNNNSIIGLRAWLLNNEIGEVNGIEILDIGCGNGAISSPYVNNNRVTFLDSSEAMLVEVKRNLNPSMFVNARFICGDFLSADLQDRYEIILLIGVVAHVSDIDAALAGIYRLLNRNGTAFIQITDSSHPLTKINNVLNKLFSIDRRKYSFNQTAHKAFVRSLDKNRLRIRKTVRYFPIRPLFTFIRKSKRLKYLVKFHRHARLAAFGSELIFVVTKDD